MPSAADVANASNLRIDRERLWQSLMRLAEIGATEKGGVCRLALTDEDREGRDLFVSWCRDAGLKVNVDRMGNIFARRAGTDETLPPIVTGSHLDSQPTGGKFDGAYGVLAGLEVIRTLNDHGLHTRAPIEVAMWTNEEGSRFAPAMVASGVYAGVFGEDYALSRADVDGKTMGDELARIGYAGDQPTGGRPFRAFFECHIEQGPVLETAGSTIGVVQGAQAQRWYEVTLTGQEAHAGTTPMANRHDALLGAARLVQAVSRVAAAHQPGVSTVGMIQSSPNSRNTIPGRVFLTVDLRHPEDTALSAMDKALRVALAEIAGEIGLDAEIAQILYIPPIHFDAACVGAIADAATKLGLAHQPIVSGAGHDACNISKVAPTGMIFVPCAAGLSHNEAESATAADLAAGADVLLHAVLDLAEPA